MDSDKIEACGYDMVKFIADYYRGLDQLPVVTDVRPGYLRKQIPDKAPVKAESWENVKNDLNKLILPGASSPAGTELEMVVMNWLADLLGLPEQFFFRDEGKGGGVLQCHCSVEKAAKIGLVRMRALPTDNYGSVRGQALKAALMEDIEKGLIPFFMCATVGTTSTCGVDNLTELGPICDDHDIWLHVDAATFGSVCICPEYRYTFDGIGHCMSLTFNPHKMLLVNFCCSVMWVKDRSLISEALESDAAYLPQVGKTSLPVYRNWGLTLSRPFRALKVWFVLRMYGVVGLQHVRKILTVAKDFAALVKQDSRFEIFRGGSLSVTCFRLQGSNIDNQELQQKINEDRRIYITPSTVKDVFILRFSPGSNTQRQDVPFAWSVIQEATNRFLKTKIH